MPKKYPEQLSVSPDQLRPNPWNTNYVTPANQAKLAESMRQLGMFKAITVREAPDGDTDYEILGGEHRWQLARDEGAEEVPIFNVGPIDDVLAKKITIADNARYGADNTLELSELLKSLGDAAEIQEFLPYSEVDLSSIFAASDIALDELELPAGYEEPKDDEPKTPKVPKTHTIMRFKIALADAERITEIITKIQTLHGYTTGDDLTNAGDALVHEFFAGTSKES